MQDSLFDVDLPIEASSWVYVIGKADSPIVKIGKATDIPKRLGSLQTSSPDRLVVRWGVIGGRALEMDLHDEFHDLRMEGEWFNFGDLDPVEEIHTAVLRLRPGQPLQIYGWRPQYSARPAEHDPHRNDPQYQPNSLGCRLQTPAERFALGAAKANPGTTTTWFWCTGHCAMPYTCYGS